MRLIFVRHAEPDYTIDSLTDKGWREAGLLAERLAGLEVRDFFTSPLGRARDTASVTLKMMDRQAREMEWLKEFDPFCWDVLPEEWTGDDRYYQPDNWFLPEHLHSKSIEEKYRWVSESLDNLIASYGYKRDGKIYKAISANNDTLVFFCHFAVSCVMIGHLINISPMVLWHGAIMAPSSVTILNTEERIKGKAVFRMSCLGDISHLYAGNEPPSFAGRFCECFDNEYERH